MRRTLAQVILLATVAASTLLVGPAISRQASRPVPLPTFQEPGRPGGLPDDRKPVVETQFSPSSAQGAADVVQSYYALIEARRFDDARRLWRGRGRASGMSRDAFVRQFASYRAYRAQVGAPGRIRGAAGSVSVEVPVSVAARPGRGADQRFRATVLLRRSNRVPEADQEARLWRIVGVQWERRGR